MARRRREVFYGTPNEGLDELAPDHDPGEEPIRLDYSLKYWEQPKPEPESPPEPSPSEEKPSE